MAVIKSDITESSWLQEFDNINFDAIVCLDVLEHLKDDNKALINFNRLLPVGGILILKVPAIKAIYSS